MIHPDFNAYSKDLDELITYDESSVADFQLYGFEWIDNLHFLHTPASVIRDDARRLRIQQAVENRFTAEGWEGTGKMSLLWLPSFTFPVNQSIPPEGVIVWHVKQEEDGISWLLSPVALPFEELCG